MLVEYRNVKQEPQGRRRWFGGDGIELIVWYGGADGIDGFQICYAADDGDERALTWRKAGGFDHARIDSGDASPLKNQTPILVPDGAVSWDGVSKLFSARSTTLEAELRRFVLDRLAARS